MQQKHLTTTSLKQFMVMSVKHTWFTAPWEYIWLNSLLRIRNVVIEYNQLTHPHSLIYTPCRVAAVDTLRCGGIACRTQINYTLKRTSSETFYTFTCHWLLVVCIPLKFKCTTMHVHVYTLTGAIRRTSTVAIATLWLKLVLNLIRRVVCSVVPIIGSHLVVIYSPACSLYFISKLSINII